jgi:Tfp pilus assembly protein PilN
MSARLNLASDPFSNRALPWTLTAVIALLSLVSLVFILRATSQNKAQGQKAQVDVTNLEQQLAAVKVKAEQVKTAFTPDQLKTLQAAHTLVDRKRFSWSLLFSDLEAALPGTVRVTRISVKDVGAAGNQTVADLELVVVSKNPTIITQMISDMEAGGTFRAELIAQNLQKGRGEIGTEYVMKVRYTPRAGVPANLDAAKNLTAMEPSLIADTGGRRP